MHERKWIENAQLITVRGVDWIESTKTRSWAIPLSGTMKNFIVASVLGHKPAKKDPFSDDSSHRKSDLDCGLRRNGRRLRPLVPSGIKERRTSRSVDRNFKVDSDDGGFSQWRNNRADDIYHPYPVCLSKRIQLVLQPEAPEAPEAEKYPFRFVQMSNEDGPQSLDFQYQQKTPKLSRNLSTYGTLPRSRRLLKYHCKQFRILDSKIILYCFTLINHEFPSITILFDWLIDWFSYPLLAYFFLYSLEWIVIESANFRLYWHDRNRFDPILNCIGSINILSSPFIKMISFAWASVVSLIN